jgi:hypothetical protein
MTSPLTTRRPIPNATGLTIATPETEAAWLALVAEKARSMQFGIIQIVVHDSRVVQVERTERTRFDVTGNKEAR